MNEVAARPVPSPTTLFGEMNVSTRCAIAAVSGLSGMVTSSSVLAGASARLRHGGVDVRVVRFKLIGELSVLHREFAILEKDVNLLHVARGGRESECRGAGLPVGIHREQNRPALALLGAALDAGFAR